MISHPAALAGIAPSLSIIIAGAWLVHQRTGNSGWVDTIWTFAVGLVEAASSLRSNGGVGPNARQWMLAVLVTIRLLRLGLHIAIPTAGIESELLAQPAWSLRWNRSSLF
jgi:steroid 5-alpha reductase family enzyme